MPQAYGYFPGPGYAPTQGRPPSGAPTAPPPQQPPGNTGQAPWMTSTFGKLWDTGTMYQPGGWGASVGSQVSGAGRQAMSGLTPALNQRRPMPGLLDTPGVGEQWWQNNQGRFTQPTRAGQYWNANQGEFRGGRVQPNATRGAWAAANGFYGQQGQGVTGARNVANRLTGNGPWIGEDAGRHAMGYFGNSGMGEGFAYDAMGSGYFGRQGEMERYFANMAGQLQGPGFGENMVRGNLGQFNRAGVAENNYGQAVNNANRVNFAGNGVNEARTDLNRNGQNTQSFYQGPLWQGVFDNAVADEQKYFAPGLRDKSYSEKIFESGSGGLVDPYARAQEKQTRQMRNVAASRGLFNTGQSMRLEQELGADIAAAEAKDRIALAGQADDARLGRTGAALDFARGVDSAGANRLGLGLQGAQAADASARGNVALNLQARGQASDEAFRRIDTQTGAADLAQRSMIDRLVSGGNLGLSADRLGIDRIMSGGQLADRAQSQGLDRYRTGMDISSRGQELGMQRMRDYFDTGAGVQGMETNRLLGGANLGLQSDAEDRARYNDWMNNANRADDRELAFDQHSLNTILNGLNAGRGLDEFDQSRMMDEFGVAERVQGMFENRERNALRDLQGLGGAQADIIRQGLDQASREAFDARLSGIEAELNNGRISQEQAQQMRNQLFASFGDLAKAAAARTPPTPTDMRVGARPGPGSAG